MKQSIVYTVIGVLVGIFVAQSAIAQSRGESEVPRTISYQGMVSSATGARFPSGDYAVTVRLYADEHGREVVWEGEYRTRVENGLLNLELGSGDYPLPGSSAMDRSLWIGIQVGEGPEMTPRTRLSAVPYALTVPDGSVTFDKLGVDYVSSIMIDGEKVTGKGSSLNITGGEGVDLRYDRLGGSMQIDLRRSGEDEGTKGDGEKGGSTQTPNSTVYWSEAGNSGTTPGTNYVGTSDAEELEIHVNSGDTTANAGDKRVMLYDPQPNSPNLIGGYQGNLPGRGSTIEGGTIGGGGRNNGVNEVKDDYGTIGGGSGNIAGGFDTTSTDDPYATVGGGLGNRAQRDYSTVGGGRENQAQGYISTVGGGDRNKTQGWYSTVGGGRFNEAQAESSTVGGGRDNQAQASYSTVGGGRFNEAQGYISTVGGGDSNKAQASYSTVGGGRFNEAQASYSTVGGGQENEAQEYSSTVGGGQENEAQGAYSTVGGGYNNQAQASFSTVGGGRDNQARGYSSTVGGGRNNRADTASAIPGGRYLTVGDNSFGFNGDNTTTPTQTDISAHNRTAYFGNVDLWIGNVDGLPRELRFYEGNNGNFTYSGATAPLYVGFKAPQALASTRTTSTLYTLPTDFPSANGALLSSSTTGTLSWSTPSQDWALTGNGGTTPGTNYVGTSDAVELEIHVNSGDTTANAGDKRVMLYDPQPNSPNLIGGYQGNLPGRGSTIEGGTIGGGGRNNGVNEVKDDYGTIGGGSGNIAGGFDTTSTDDPYATVGGGLGNRAQRDYSTVGGGRENQAQGYISTVGGGDRNKTQGWYSTVGGGRFNEAQAESSTVGGGRFNEAQAESSTVGGGRFNEAQGYISTVGGGDSNKAQVDHSTVGGGRFNEAQASYSTVGGGQENEAQEYSSTVGGGQENEAQGAYSTVGGGYNNQAQASFSTVGGGRDNQARGYSSTVGGGRNNRADTASAIPGGRYLTVGDNSFGFNGDNTTTPTQTNISAHDQTAYLGNVDLWIGNVDNTPRQLRFYEGSSTDFDYATRNYVGFKAPHTVTTTQVYTLPDPAPAASPDLSILTGNNAGVLSWTSVLQVANGGTGIGTTTPNGVVYGSSSGSFAFTPAGAEGQVLTSGTGGVPVWSTPSQDWALTGNGGTRPGTNYVGTSDAKELEIHVNSGNTTANAGDKRVMLYDPQPNSPNLIGGYQENLPGRGSTIEGATIGGGGKNNRVNEVKDDYGTIGGGAGNVVGGLGTTSTTDDTYATVGGGRDNQARAQYSTVGGGRFNQAQGYISTVGGGDSNQAQGYHSTVGGGEGNEAQVDHSTVGGGSYNQAREQYATVGGGRFNQARGYHSTVGGGLFNEAQERYSTVGGGRNNRADTASAIPGGRYLTVGDNSFGFNGDSTTTPTQTDISAHNRTAYFGNVDLWIGNVDSLPRELRFYVGNNGNFTYSGATAPLYVGFKAPQALASTRTTSTLYTLPTDFPSANGALLSSSTTGTLSWSTPSQDWALTGNGGTTPLSSGTGHYLGTSDATDLVIATASEERIGISGTTGEVTVAKGLTVDGNTTLGDDRTDAVTVSGGLSQTGTQQVSFSGNVDATNGLDVTGGLIVDTLTVNGLDVTGTLTVDTLTVSGATTLSGNLDMNGNDILDGTDDNITILEDLVVTGKVNPSANNTYTLGTDANRWSELFVNGGSVHIGDANGDANDDEMVLGYNGTTTGTIGVNGTTSMNITTTDVNFTGNTDIDGALAVDGNTTLGDDNRADAVTVNGGLSQTGGQQVRFSGNVDATNGLDVTNADLTVGGTDGTHFIVDDVTGNTDIDGTLTVDGDARFNGNVDATNGLDVTGGLTVDTLTVNGLDVTGGLTVDTLTVSGATTLSGNLDMNGNDILDGTDGNITILEDLVVTGKVNPSANNTYTLGTDANRWSELFVTGGSVHIGDANGDANDDEMVLGYNGTTTGTIGVNGTTSMNITTTDVNFTGNTDIDGALAVDGNTTLGDDNRADAVTVNGGLSQTGGQQVRFSGNVDATNGLDVTNADLTVGGTDGTHFIVDDVTGNTDIDGTLTVDGDARFNGNVDATNGLDVTGGLTVDTITVNGLNVTGTLTVDTLTVSGATALSGNLDMNGNDILDGTDGNITILEDLVVTGKVNPSANNTYTLGTDANRWSELFVTGGSVHIGDANGDANDDEMVLGYDGTTTGTIGVNGTTSMNITTTDVTFTGNTDIDGALAVDGNTRLGGDVGIGTNVPNVSLDVDGGLAIRPPDEITITQDNVTVDPGDRSFLRIDSDSTPANRTIVLADGDEGGQILVIQCIASARPAVSQNFMQNKIVLQQQNGIELLMSEQNHAFTSNKRLEDRDNLYLIWDEANSYWLEIGHTDF